MSERERADHEHARERRPTDDGALAALRLFALDGRVALVTGAWDVFIDWLRITVPELVAPV